VKSSGRTSIALVASAVGRRLAVSVRTRHPLASNSRAMYDPVYENAPVTAATGESVTAPYASSRAPSFACAVLDAHYPVR
jgi:hypothetical protein